MRDKMKAVMVHEKGGPEVLKIETRPVPQPERGQVLIRVKAFGLNRSELFTRQGHSPNVLFPRVLGIEAVGTVAVAPGGEFLPGEMVVTVMGGMGRTSCRRFTIRSRLIATCLSGPGDPPLASPSFDRASSICPPIRNPAWACSSAPSVSRGPK